MSKQEKEAPAKKNYFKFRYLVVAYIPVLLPVAGIIRILLYLFLFAATSYYIINLFSRLTGINMFSAYAWSLHLPGGKPFFLFPLGAGLCFTIAFIVMIVLFKVPAQVQDFKNNNAAGLMGYRDAKFALWLYNPVHNEYIPYNDNTIQKTPERFTDLFKVIVLYKAPDEKFYLDTLFLGLSSNTQRVFLIILFLAAIYPLLYLLAVFYIKDEGLTMELTNYVVLSRFREIAGMHPGLAGAVFIAVLMIIPVYGMIEVNKVIDQYNGIYGAHRERLINQIKQRVLPGSTVRGSVIQRFIYKESETTGDSDSRNRSMNKKVSYYTFCNYTVKFDSLIQIPVYLEMHVPYGSEEAKMLEKAFTDIKTYVPSSVREYDFTVNDDYSVSPPQRPL